MKIKPVLRIAIMAVLVFVCTICMMNSANAFNAKEEGEAITSNPDLIYTVYLGMPRSDVRMNFKSVEGWKYKESSIKVEISRKYSSWAAVKAGADLTQRFTAIFGGDNRVSAYTARFETDSLRFAKEIYQAMYENLVLHYGDPYRFTEFGGLGISAMWISNGKEYELSRMKYGEKVVVNFVVRNY